MNRIQKAFDEKKKVFIGFVTAGDPNLATTKELVRAMIKGGAGLIEFGIPFSDPVAEGEVIQKADMRALAAGTTTDKIFDLVAELREVIDELYLDDTVDIIEEMPATIVKRILKNTDSQTRASINTLLKYPEDSAGSIMTPEFVDLKKTNTVEDAFKRIRRTGVDKETIYTCYVTDESRHLIGVTTVKELLLHDYEDVIGDFMETNTISLNTLDDQELATQLFDKYNFLALPVVDMESRLVGIITVDDAIDVIQEENTEDLQKMNAMLPTEKTCFWKK